MHDGWQVAVRGEPRPTRRVLTRRERMYVSLNKRGEIVMNARAIKELGGTQVVILMFDKARREIGIRPPGPREWDYFRTRKYGRGRRMRIVRAARMLRQFGIAVNRTLVFQNIGVRKFEEKPMLVLELDTAAYENRSSATNFCKFSLNGLRLA